MEGNFTFRKQDIFCNLEGTVPEARSKDTEALQEGAVALPTATAIGVWSPAPQKPRGQVTTSLHHQDAPLVMSPHQQNLSPNLLRLTYLGLWKFPQGAAQ